MNNEYTKLNVTCFGHDVFCATIPTTFKCTVKSNVDGMWVYATGDSLYEAFDKLTASVRRQMEGSVGAEPNSAERSASLSPKFAAPYGGHWGVPGVDQMKFGVQKPEVTVSFTRVSDDGTDELYEATGETYEEAMANLKVQLDDADEETKTRQHDKLWENILEYVELASSPCVDENYKAVEAKLGPLADIVGSLIAEAIDEEDEDFYEDAYERLEALEDKVEALEKQRLENMSAVEECHVRIKEDLDIAGVLGGLNLEEDDSIKVTPHQMTRLSNLLDDMLKEISDIVDRTGGLFTNPHEINRKACCLRADIGTCKALLQEITND